jgi:hypothetical protein
MVTVTHATVAVIPDDGTSEVGSDEWNAAHVVTGIAEVLTGDRTYYVSRDDGSDSDDGLTAGNAFATIQKAVDTVMGLDFNNDRTINVTIDVADSASSYGIIRLGPLKNFAVDNSPNNYVIIQGNPSDPEATQIETTVLAGGSCVTAVGKGAYWKINDMSLKCGVNFTNCIAAALGAVVNLEGNVVLEGRNNSYHCTAVGSGTAVSVDGTIEWRAPSGGRAMFFAQQYAICGLGGDLTLTGTPAWSIACLAANGGGGIFFAPDSITGSATGMAYLCDFGSFCDLNGGVPGQTPSSTAGSSRGGFVYPQGDDIYGPYGTRISDVIRLTGDGVVGITEVRLVSGGYIGGPSGTIGLLIGETTFGALPAAATAGSGARAFITDCNTATFLATAAAGGSNKVPVVSDGTNWLVG